LTNKVAYSEPMKSRTADWRLFVKWRNGRHLESVTSPPKSDFVTRGTNLPNFIQIGFETTEPWVFFLLAVAPMRRRKIIIGSRNCTVVNHNTTSKLICVEACRPLFVDETRDTVLLLLLLLLLLTAWYMVMMVVVWLWCIELASDRRMRFAEIMNLSSAITPQFR